MPSPVMMMPAPAAAPPAAPYTSEQLRNFKKIGFKDNCCSLCAPLADISPLIQTPEGTRINPLFDVVKQYHLAGDPYSTTLAAGATSEVAFSVPAEENSYGDFLVSELMASTSVIAPTYVKSAVFLTSKQNDRQFMNVPILSTFIFGTSQLSKTLPCCFLIQATNFVQMRVTSLEASTSQTVRFVAKGTRILPYQYPELRDQLLAYWNQYKSTPYWLGIDTVTTGTGIAIATGGGVTIPAGSTATAILTVPGGGDFGLGRWLCDVDGGLSYIDPSSIDILISEGVGRQMMNQAVSLGDFVAQPNKYTSGGSQNGGFQGGVFRGADGGHGEGAKQFFKRNSRIRVQLTNNGSGAVTVYLAAKGCMHYYDECAPNKGLNQSLSLEPTVGPMLVESPRCPPIHEFGPSPYGGLVPVNGPAPMIPATGFTLPGTTPGVAQPGMTGMGRFHRGMRGIEPADGGFRARGSW